MQTVLAVLLLGIAGAVMWGREHPPSNGMAEQRDVPVRLLQWANGQLPAGRVEWGRAMLGELDRIEGRSRRWRFALGCVGGTVLLPPWGSLGPMAGLAAVALGGAVVFGFGFVHFGLATSPWNWVVLAILSTLVICCLVAVSVQLRRVRVAPLGLAGGLFVAGAWLVVSGFTWQGIINPIYSVGAWSSPELYVAVPVAVGVAGAWISGSASVGRRAARLAGVSAGLVMFFIGTLAVVAIDGGPRDPGATIAGGVSEAFSNVAMTYLVSVPLAAAAVGWVAATATARIRSVCVTQLVPDPMSSRFAGVVSLARQNRAGARTMRRVLIVVAVLAVITLIFQA